MIYIDGDTDRSRQNVSMWDDQNASNSSGEEFGVGVGAGGTN